MVTENGSFWIRNLKKPFSLCLKVNKKLRSRYYDIGGDYSSLLLIPLSVNIAYRDRFAGKNNVLDTQYIHWDCRSFSKTGYILKRRGSKQLDLQHPLEEAVFFDFVLEGAAADAKEVRCSGPILIRSI
jgi:hypothetical protein